MARHTALYAGSFDPITFGHLDVLAEPSSATCPQTDAEASTGGKRRGKKVVGRERVRRTCSEHGSPPLGIVH